MPEYCCVRDGKGILLLLTIFQTGAEHAIGLTWPEDALIRIAYGFHDPFLGKQTISDLGLHGAKMKKTK